MPSKKKTTTKSTKTAAKPVKTPVTVAPPPAPEQVATPTLPEQFNAVLGQLSALRSQLTSVTSQVRALSKRSEREIKVAVKSSRKKRKAGNRAPSGFVKPTKISTELAKFLGKPLGSEMARTQVTREINGYIREHKLQDPKNGRRILADKKLKKLLKLKDSDELTYFNLQRYMSPHFAKAGKALVEPVTASA
tara:strand:- start:170 stop:745 length:576 start_codon:yes stop_codon:yes gene_type:complete